MTFELFEGGNSLQPAEAAAAFFAPDFLDLLFPFFHLEAAGGSSSPAGGACLPEAVAMFCPANLLSE